MQITPALLVINAFGGVRETARILERDPSSVSRWKKRGNIPQDLHATVLKQAKKLGRRISANDLVYGRKSKK